MTETNPTPLLLDSKAAINLALDPVAFKKTKHILRAAHELRDRVARGIFTARYVEAENQLADIMTKALRVHLHRDMLSRILQAHASHTHTKLVCAHDRYDRVGLSARGGVVWRPLRACDWCELPYVTDPGLT